MLPYGNAKMSGSSVQCQHGPTECKYNMVEACGIKHNPQPEDYMDFIFCVEAAAAGHADDVNGTITKCAKDANVAHSISTCYGEGSGQEGSSLIASYAAQTNKLGHQYTPWVVLNGKHSEAAENNLKKAVCKAYKGSNPPAACKVYAVERCFKNDVTGKEGDVVLQV
eukprot:TRINITY_DN24733_c0_g1_i1.p1 TRINITY_DN24733_c0_g1~~TRINITY_DN24733_c0_g1_i1.p1  ORF type:complete len:167 (+),score=39.84 TRINITY_DN24733_c0_g1_i1:214-714(+)